jgi:glutathione synthase/RimK-type ligase-like ATP-grasp enzyme
LTGHTAGRPRVALAASAAYPDLLEEGPLLIAALDRAGLAAETVVWNDPDVGWNDFDLVLANGVWDNIRHLERFVRWTHDLEQAGVAVVNPPGTLRWNLDKRYLRALEEADLAVVPTTWVEALGPVELEGEVVVKPAISGGGHLTARYEPHEYGAAQRHIDDLVGAGGVAMVQPYQAAVDEEGEVGLVFLGGTYSHAIHKAPMIERGAGPLDDLIANQVIVATTPTESQVALGQRAVRAADEILGPTTYARVDIVPGPDGAPVLLELELLDPLLFFAWCPDKVDGFARVLAERVTANTPAPRRAP